MANNIIVYFTCVQIYRHGHCTSSEKALLNGIQDKNRVRRLLYEVCATNPTTLHKFLELHKIQKSCECENGHT